MMVMHIYYLPGIENDWGEQVKKKQVFTECKNLGTLELGDQQHHQSRTQTLNLFNQTKSSRINKSIL
jgi:hypothetical protein